jgi:hypothetical protein
MAARRAAPGRPLLGVFTGESWRHEKVVFGVDFTRKAVIRRFNLGVARVDKPAGDPFAGELKRLNPFHSCVSCGGTTTDGPPAGARTDTLMTSGATSVGPASPGPVLVDQRQVPGQR